MSLELNVVKISNKIEENKITIVIDTSGSTYKNLSLIKSVASLFLKQLSYRDDTLFNLISFSKMCASFSDTLVSANAKDNIILAQSWIDSLQSESTTNMLSALAVAFDDLTESVLLITDSLSTQKPSVLMKCVIEMSLGRPLHVIYVNAEACDYHEINLLKKITEHTNGTFQLLTKEVEGDAEIRIKRLLSPNYADELVHLSNSINSFKISCGNTGNVSRIQEDHSCNLLGKTVLARQSINGYYYKGTVIKQPSNSPYVKVLFQSSRDVKQQKEEDCELADVVLYENAKNAKVCKDDFVLVNIDLKKKYYPGQVMSSEYLYDEDGLTLMQVFSVEFFNGEQKVVPQSCTVYISRMQYETIVKELISRGEQNTSMQVQENVLQNENVKDGTMVAQPKAFIKSLTLKDKIEQQLAEGKQVLKELTSTRSYDPFLYKSIKMNHNNDCYDSGYAEGDAIHSSQGRHLRSQSTDDMSSSGSDEIFQIPYSPGTKEYSRQYRVKSTEPTSQQNLQEVDYLFPLCTIHNPLSDPCPPKLSNKNTKRSSSRSSRSRFRSASVGANVVERSKKHWTGRPITREASPQKSPLERYSEFHRVHPPHAEEYQTFDGTPFPPRTDRRIAITNNNNWFPTKQQLKDYKYHDIVAHRVVEFEQVRTKPKPRISIEEKEQNRINARKSNREYREEKEAITKENRKVQLEEREAHVRKIKEEKEKQGYTKMKITLEKDESKLRYKQRKYDERLKYEAEREAKNQARKYDRIDALKERRKNNDQLVITNQKKQDNLETQREQQYKTREEKRNHQEKQRLDNQIKDHESKLNRLKELRKKTDARMMNLKKDNDNYRDNVEHVKQQRNGILRACYLP